MRISGCGRSHHAGAVRRPAQAGGGDKYCRTTARSCPTPGPAVATVGAVSRPRPDIASLDRARLSPPTCPAWVWCGVVSRHPGLLHRKKASRPGSGPRLWVRA